MGIFFCGLLAVCQASRMEPGTWTDSVNGWVDTGEKAWFSHKRRKFSVSKRRALLPLTMSLYEAGRWNQGADLGRGSLGSRGAWDPHSGKCGHSQSCQAGPLGSSSCRSFKKTKGGRASTLHAEHPPRPGGRSARVRLCPQTHGEGRQASEGRAAREPGLGGDLSKSSVDRAAGSLLGGGQGAPGSVWSVVGVLCDLPSCLSLAWL